MRPIQSILFVTHHFPPEVGGIQTRISKYLTILDRWNIHSSVLVVRASSQLAGLEHFGPNIRLFRVDGRMQSIPRDLLTLLSVMRDQKVDVVHVFSGASTVFGVLALGAGRSRRLITAMSVFGREDMQTSNAVRRVLLFVSIRLATAILANSNATLSLLPSSGKNKARLLLGGADLPSQSELSGGPSRRKSVLFVGRLVRRKGVDDLVAAMSEIVAVMPDARLVIVGDGPERRQLEELVMRLALTDNVSFRGTLRGRRLEDEYERCDVFVLPSKDVPNDFASEGLGLALVEAAMHGRPLVGTIHGGIPELVHDGVNGLLVPPGEPMKLAKAIRTILSDDDIAQRMGKNAQEEARSHFTWESATRRLLMSYIPASKTD